MRRLGQAHCAKRAKGKPNSEVVASCHSSHASQATGNTKPNSTGQAHSATASSSTAASCAAAMRSFITNQAL